MNMLNTKITAEHVARFPGDRGDGYHHNDPNAPDVWRCGCCNTIREQEVQWCVECLGKTAAYLDRQSDEPVLWLGSAWPATEAF